MESNSLWSGLGWLILTIVFCSIGTSIIYIIEKRYLYSETRKISIKHDDIQRKEIDSIEGILFHDVKV